MATKNRSVSMDVHNRRKQISAGDDSSTQGSSNLPNIGGA